MCPSWLCAFLYLYFCLIVEHSFIHRTQCVELCRMPALTITLTLDYAKNCGDEDSDIVPFVTSLLLHNDIVVRNWFSQFIRSRQKRNRESSAALQALREELLRHLSSIVDFSHDNKLPMSCVVQASALLRLYCALRGIANIKFQDDETSLIVKLMTSHPPPTPEGVRLVSLSLCMLVACPSLIGKVYVIIIIHYILGYFCSNIIICTLFYYWCTSKSVGLMRTNPPLCLFLYLRKLLKVLKLSPYLR